MYANKILTNSIIITLLLNTLSCAEKFNVQNSEILHYEPKGKNMNDYDKKYDYDYKLIQKDKDLIFLINLTNITNKDLKIPKAIMPYGIFNKDKQITTSIIFPSYGIRPEPKYDDIKVGENYVYKFKINEEFNLLEGVEKYDLKYISENFNIDTTKEIDSKYRKTIEFVWKKDKEGDGGKLISVTYPE